MAEPLPLRLTVYAAISAGVLLILLLVASLDTGPLAYGLAAVGVLLIGAGVAVLTLEQRSRKKMEAQVRMALQEATNARREAERRADDMRRLGEFSEQLQACRTAEETGEVLGGAMNGLLPQFVGALYLKAPGRNVLRRQVGWGKSDPPLEEMFGPDDCWALRRGSTHPIDAMGPRCGHVAETVKAAHCLCVPLHAHDGTPIGVLHFEGSAPPNTVERRLGQAIGDLLTLAISGMRLQEALRVQAARDPLTGLPNRRTLDATLMREGLRSRRRGLTMAILMLDIDQFKRFNERYGHDVGDAALAQLGSTLAQSIRETDIACRYGGEEFAVVIPEADLTTAKEQAEALRRAIRNTPIESNGRRLDSLSVSIGIAVYPLHGNEPELCLRAADRALFLAKQNGRDRIEIAEEMPAQQANGKTGAS